MSSLARPLGALIVALEARGQLRSVVPGPGAVAAGTGGPIAARQVTGVAMDSRRVRPGDLFVAVPGRVNDGHDFAAEAAAAGATAVLVERPLPGLRVPQLVVTAARPALAQAASWWWGDPSQRLGVVGITGTDGKTTTAYLIRSILEQAGLPAGMISTIEVIVGGARQGNPARATTPEAPVLQGFLAAMVAAGDRFAVIETSSHGLAQDRVAGVAYDVAVLTNLTHEHLEFHGTLQAYAAAKRRLFQALARRPGEPTKPWPRTGIVNLDDPAAPSFAAVASEAGAAILTYGFDEAAVVQGTSLGENLQRLRVGIRTPRWAGHVDLALAGRFNAANALAAAAFGEALGLDPEAIRAGLEAVTSVPGRMERIDAGQPFAALVDYAHTPDALGKVLDGLAPLAGAAGGGLIAVFGSAGERDVLKRARMGRIAGERCRLVVLTDEDPRGEPREAILAEIAEGVEAAGLRRGSELRLVPDRRAAIALALEAARPGDAVLFAGKGHEKTIETAEGDVPWDEATEVRAALARLGWDAPDPER